MKLLNYANAQKEVMARTGGYGDKELKQRRSQKSTKKKKIRFSVANDTWIYKELHPYVHEANRNAGWNFDWDKI